MQDAVWPSDIPGRVFWVDSESPYSVQVESAIKGGGGRSTDNPARATHILLSDRNMATLATLYQLGIENGSKVLDILWAVDCEEEEVTVDEEPYREMIEDRLFSSSSAKPTASSSRRQRSPVKGISGATKEEKRDQPALKVAPSAGIGKKQSPSPSGRPCWSCHRTQSSSWSVLQGKPDACNSCSKNYKHNGEVGLAQWRERARAIALAKNPTSAGIARPPSSSSLAGLRSPSVAQGEKRKRDSLAPSSASLSTISSRPLGTDAPSPDPLALQARDVPPAAPRDRTPPPPPARQVGEPPIFARIGHPPRSRRETDDDWCWACGRCSSECTPLDLAVQHSVQGVVKSQRRCCESCRKYFKRAESDLALDQIEATEKVVRRGLKARKALVEASLVG